MRQRSPRKFRAKPSAPHDKGGEGREIVQELTACPDCAKKHEAEAQEVAAREAAVLEAAEKARLEALAAQAVPAADE